METIYLNPDEFDSFIEKKYALVQPAHKKPGAKKLYSISVRQLIPFEKNNLILLSLVVSITIPDANRIPQLKTLYGIPAGLIHVDTNSIPKKLPVSKPISLTDKDILYRTFRRSLLYLHVWAIKGMEIDVLRVGIQPLLEPKYLEFLKQWVVSLVSFGKYPEAKKQTSSIDDTVFDKQFIGLGKFLKTYFFPFDEIMDEEHRQWLFGLREAKITDAPTKFKGIEPLLGGYLIALKASNENKKDLTFIIEKTNKFELKDTNEKYAYIVSALFFIGMFESVADQYFMGASAAGLFVSIERFAFSLVYQSATSNFFDNDYQAIRDSILDPIPNCVAYYKLKNPSIKDSDIFEFNNQSEFEYPQKVVLLRPKQSVDFIQKQSAIYPLMDQYRNKLCITNDRGFFESFRKNSIPTVLYEKGGYLSGQFRMKANNGMLATSPGLKRAISMFIKPKKEVITENFIGIEKNWLVVLNEYQIDSFEKYLLKRAFEVNKPDSITVFNVATKKVKVEQDTLFEKGYRGKSKTENNPFKQTMNNVKVSTYSNSSLQSDFELMCPDTICRIITKYQTDTPWELVQLGIGALQYIDFNDCSLLDLRLDKSDKSIYEYVLRCFRDVIVYDEYQRYLFLNL